MSYIKHAFFASIGVGAPDNPFSIIYPRATSITIIKIKPKINPIVVRFLFPVIASGRSSLATTVIIAPAANERKNGSVLLMNDIKTTPNNSSYWFY